MKTIRALMFVLFVSLRAFGAEPSLEFRGVMVGGGATKLSLVDKTTDTTRWVEVGKSFAGFTVKAYDVSTETATLTKDGKELRIRLNTSRILEAPAPAPAAPAEIVVAVRNNLRQIAAAADQYYLETGGNSVALYELVGPTKYIKQLIPVDGESYAGMQLKAGVSIIVKTAKGVSVSYEP